MQLPSRSCLTTIFDGDGYRFGDVSSRLQLVCALCCWHDVDVCSFLTPERVCQRKCYIMYSPCALIYLPRAGPVLLGI